MSRAGVVAAFGSVAALCGSWVSWRDDPPRTSAATESAAVAIDGASLFKLKGCASCHSGPDTRAAFGEGFPSLAEVGEWAADRAPGLTGQEYVVQSILAPSLVISPEFSGTSGPTEAMPALGLSEAEAEAIAAYLLAP